MIKKFNILKFLLIFFGLFFLVYFVDKFFDNYDLKFRSPVIIRSPILIEKRIKNKPAGRKGVKSNALKKSTARLPAGEKEEIFIKEYPKYMTKEAFELRSKVLTYLQNKLSKNELIAFDNILKKESGYNPEIINEIGAGGLCQAYPYQKMPCQLSQDDWKCQVNWCLKYVENRYKNSIEAWKFHEKNNWF